MIDTLHVFCSAPSPKLNEDYDLWLNKIETKMGETLKSRGIYDLIQLSRIGHLYFQNMFIATLYFWESSTNTFQLPCGMVTPTLFDIVAITGLLKTSDSFDPNERDENTMNSTLTIPDFANTLKTIMKLILTKCLMKNTLFL